MKKPFRKIFHFSPVEKAWLQQLAKEAEVSEAQVVRDLVCFAAQRAGLPEPRLPATKLELMLEGAQAQ